MTLFSAPTPPAPPAVVAPPPAPKPSKRPPAWSLRNWPVRWKVLAIVLVPLLLAMVFGGLRVRGELDNSGELRLAAARADVIPAITRYMSSLDTALLASSTGSDVDGAKKNFDARKRELQARLGNTDAIPDVRSAISTLLNGGQALLDKVLAGNIGLRDRVTSYAPLLLTAENAIDASVRVDSEQIRRQVRGLSRAVRERGQMTLQQILTTRGADLPEPALRILMIMLEGTEPSTLFGISEALGAGSAEAKTLQQQMLTRMGIMSDPASDLVANAGLLRSVEVTVGIAEKVIADGTTAVTTSVDAEAAARRAAAIRDAALVLGALALALVIVLLVARSLIKPLRVLRDGALKVAHTDLEGEIARVRAGADPSPEPLAVYTTEEIGQVAHAVDELHAQALLMAGDEARLRLLVNDMFETMSRRSRSLVDQQLALIDGLERDEQDPERLQSLFRLDHLAARLRRNSANLLVLAGAQITRDNREPVPLATVINAAVSEVEDYRRVEIGGLVACTVTGAAAGGVIHLLAELIDNALRYSPPTTPVRLSAVRASSESGGGVLMRIADSGLGMNEADRRMANTRLQTGGPLSAAPDIVPENARHMGFFVVNRLAERHGIRVGLRGPAAGASPADGKGASGTTAEVYLPVGVLVVDAPAQPVAPAPAVPAEPTPTPAPAVPANRNGAAGPPVTLLPRRNPGSSGITDVPVPPPDQPQRAKRELPTPWWENGFQQQQQTAPPTAPPVPSAAPPVPAPSAPKTAETAAFFARRPTPSAAPPAAAPPPAAPDSPDDVIYQRMLSEMVGDPRDLADSPDLDWQTVWDRGWSAAAEADSRPVEAHTDQGLPVRTPGVRLVPGAAEPEPPAAHAARDPETVRATFSNHFGGVQAGRSRAQHAREVVSGSEHQ